MLRIIKAARLTIGNILLNYKDLVTHLIADLIVFIEFCIH